MQYLTDFLNTIDSYLGSSQWFVFLLLGTGLFFTIYLGFPQFKFFRHAIRVTTGKYDTKTDKGDTSHFGALSTALSGTIGTGNIAGVALAIHLGGPAALFWMLITAILGMTTKMVEVTLSIKYRETAEDGSFSGGPMYYMRNRLNAKWLAVIFAVATIFSSFGTGSLPQINSIANSFEATWGVDKVLVGVVLSVLLGLVIIGGIKRISKVAQSIVPTMAVIYVIGGLSVLVFNYQNIVPSIISIFTDVFNGTAATGGFLGAGFAWAFNRGVNRGLFSNEAGQGSAPIAHSAARTSEPVSEGMVSLLEPFIDTIIICFTTGLILLSSGVWSEKIDNRFQLSDMHIIEGNHYRDDNPEHVAAINTFLSAHSMGATKSDSDASSSNALGVAKAFDGILEVTDGHITTSVTTLHSRSIAENVVISRDGEPFTGALNIEGGKITDEVDISGQSLLHSAPLTTEAFKRGVMGEIGGYIVPICLLLFAFSTAIAWSYYGDRAITFLFGVRYVPYFRVIYTVAFCFGAFVDTTIIWLFSSVTIVFMALPNLIGILLLRKDIKQSLNEYWTKFKKEHPKE